MTALAVPPAVDAAQILGPRNSPVEGTAVTVGSPIDVLLRATWIVGVGYRYDVILDGKTIVRRSRDPEHEAARALLSRGLRGQFCTLDFSTGQPRMILDIANAARLRVVERDAGGPPVLGVYRPMSDEEKGRARVHRSYQDRVVAEQPAQAPPAPIGRFGGKRGVARRNHLPTKGPERKVVACNRRPGSHRRKG